MTVAKRNEILLLINILLYQDHQYENTTTVEGYEGAGEYMAILQYTDQLGNVIDTEQIMALVDASESCRQYIR